MPHLYCVWSFRRFSPYTCTKKPSLRTFCFSFVWDFCCIASRATTKKHNIVSADWLSTFGRICQNKQLDTGLTETAKSKTNVRWRIVYELTTLAFTAIGNGGANRWDQMKDQNRQTGKKCCYWRWATGKDSRLVMGGRVQSQVSANGRQTNGDGTR